MTKKVKTKDLFECRVDYLVSLFEKYEYPWEMLPVLKEYISEIIRGGIDGYKEIADGILVGENVEIHPSAVIKTPAIIGSESEIRPCAYIRGAVVTGKGCVIGNSSELKNCILLDYVQVPHYNYVGDSVLGNYAHMGAGAICSNLKADKRNVVIHTDEEIETGIKKIGGILGDKADVGCGCVLNPGTVIGKNTSVYPLNSLRGVFPEDSIVKAQTLVVKRR